MRILLAASGIILLATAATAEMHQTDPGNIICNNDAFKVAVLPLPKPPSRVTPRPPDWTDAVSNIRDLNDDGLRSYYAAIGREHESSTVETQAANWRQLAKAVPQLAELATKRAQDWDRSIAERKVDGAAWAMREKDWDKLRGLLTMGQVPEACKVTWSLEFLKAYWRWFPLEEKMAKELAAHLTPTAAGVEWVPIPGGSFMMGSGDAEAGPPHRVTIQPFALAKTLVTNMQYEICRVAGACTPLPRYEDELTGEDQPAVGPTWDQAAAFSRWVGGRLPSEAEWEYAARSAGQQWQYPWGQEEATCKRAVISGCGDSTAPVCSRRAGSTRQGLCDMSGNAWQWVQDWYHYSYDGAPSYGTAWEKPAGEFRVMRGGSWTNIPESVRTTYRLYNAPGRGERFVGFRPAR
jgi:formylglycine-generating enzyme required for sulfatase activity